MLSTVEYCKGKYVNCGWVAQLDWPVCDEGIIDRLLNVKMSVQVANLI